MCKRRLTDRIDVYSFAMVVYEMVERVRPWKGVSRLQIVISILKQQERPLAPNLQRGHPGLWALVQQAWAQDPAQRPSAAEVRALEATLAAVSPPDTYARPPSSL